MNIILKIVVKLS